MTITHATIDVPRPFIDIITSTAEALSIFALSISHPIRPEVLVLLVDAHRRGIGLIGSPEPHINTYSPTSAGHSLGHHVVGITAQHPGAQGCYVLSVEPNSQPGPDDAERWFAFNDICDCAGLVLIDWCVRSFSTAANEWPGRGALWCPKHVAGLG